MLALYILTCGNEVKKLTLIFPIALELWNERPSRERKMNQYSENQKIQTLKIRIKKKDLWRNIFGKIDYIRCP